jgi:hypothetical protein
LLGAVAKGVDPGDSIFEDADEGLFGGAERLLKVTRSGDERGKKSATAGVCLLDQQSA